MTSHSHAYQLTPYNCLHHVCRVTDFSISNLANLNNHASATLSHVQAFDIAMQQKYYRLVRYNSIEVINLCDTTDGERNEEMANDSDAVTTYQCGALTYTKVGLAVLFAFLIWGDVCFTLMEHVQSVVPLKLKSLGCPNWVMGVVLSTIPGILNMTVCPWVSYKSDRHRGRWGRRIPFILFTMPFLCASLILIGLSEDLVKWIQPHSDYLLSFTPATLAIGLISIFMICFAFFNMFVNSVFWYLFNDVIPAQFLGRFVAIIRIVGTGAGAFYNFFIFQYSESHMREVLIGGALLYFVGFGITCLKVKEGEYPAIEELQEKKPSRLHGLKAFATECFTHKFYWSMFGFMGMGAMGASVGMFWVFFHKEMGLDLHDIGLLVGTGGVAGTIAMALAATFVDRWHPLRVTVYSSIFTLVGSLIPCIWLFVTLPPKYYFWLCLSGALTGAFQLALVNVSSLPKDMRMFPHSRFGQFCSAQAMFRSGRAMAGGILTGVFCPSAHLPALHFS